MGEVKNEWKNNSFTEEGAYIAPSIMANEKNYIKKIISIQMNKTKSANNPDLVKNNDEVFSVYPNPVVDYATVHFTLNESKVVNLKIYDLQGRLRNYVIDNQMYAKGRHEVSLNLANLESGVYICKLSTEEHVYNRKILIK